MRFLTLATIVAAGACFCGRANGSIVYNYVTNGSTFSASPGGTTSVNVYLQETVTGTDTSLLVSDNGLRGAGFSVTETVLSQRSSRSTTRLERAVTSRVVRPLRRLGTRASC